MRTIHWLICVAVVGAGGIGVGWLIAPRGETDTKTDLSACGEASQDSKRTSLTGNPELGDKTAQPPAIPEEPVGPPKQVPPNPENDALLAALRSVELDPLPAGTGEITGTAIDELGKPLQGVIVQLTPRGRAHRVTMFGSHYSTGQLWTGLAEDVRSLVRMRTSWRPEPLRTQTDADGSFHIGGLGETDYYIFAEHPDYSFETEEGDSYAKPGSHVEFWAFRSEVVTVEVEFPIGVAPETCIVQHRHVGVDGMDRPIQHSGGARWTTRARPGLHSFSARCGNPVLSSEQVLLRIQAGSGEQLVKLAVAPVPTIRGRIMWIGGTFVGYVTVVATLAPESADSVTVLEQAVRNYRALQGELVGDGYRISATTPGRYIVGLWSDSRLLASHEVNHEGSEAVLDFEVIAPAEGITCIVRQAQGRPAAGRTFTLASSDDRTREELNAWRISPGEYRLEPPAIELQAPLDLIVDDSNAGSGRAALAHFGPQTVEVTIPATAPLVLKLNEWRAPPGTTLYLERIDERGKVAEEASSHGAGDLVALRHAPLGRQRIQVTLRCREGSILLHAQEVEVGGDGAVVEPGLPTLHTVTLSYGGSENITFKLLGKTANDEFDQTLRLQDGQLTLNYLPEGTYTISWRSRRAEEDTLVYFDVPAATKVDLGE